MDSLTVRHYGDSEPAYLRLPPEITYEIIKTLDMRDIINLALTCSKFFSVLEEHRALHQQNKAKFTNLLITDEALSDNPSFPLDLMRCLVRGDSYAHEYLTRVHVHDPFRGYSARDDDTMSAFIQKADAIIDHQDSDEIWQAVEKKLSSTRIQENCMEFFRGDLEGNSTCLVMILLALMPRLRDLRLTGHPYSHYPHVGTIARLFLHGKEPVILFQSLTKVEISVEVPIDNNESKESFGGLAFYSQVPSVKYLKGTEVGEPSRVNPLNLDCIWEQDIQPSSSNAESLTLICLGSVNDFRSCLQAFKALRSFEYRHGALFHTSSRDDYGEYLLPLVYGILQHLAAYAARSLEHLVFTTLAHGGPRIPTRGRGTTNKPTSWIHFLGSLTQLRRLRSVHTHSHLFWPFGPQNRRPFDPNSVRVQREQGDIFAYPRALSTIFPPSIEKITLDGEVSMIEVWKLVGTIIDDTDGTKHLPRLHFLRFTDVVFERKEGEIQQIEYCREICGFAAVKLVLTPRSVNYFLLEDVKAMLTEYGMLFVEEEGAEE